MMGVSSFSCGDRWLAREKGRRVLAGLPWRRNNAKLLQHTEVIETVPLFGDLAIRHPQDADARCPHLLAGGRYSHQFPLVRATPVVAHRDLISFSVRFFGGDPQVGE